MSNIRGSRASSGKRAAICISSSCSRSPSSISCSRARLRPILMTTGAMVLGAVPLALATGAGAENRQDIGWVIVGGLLVGTLFTLFVIPLAYTYLSRREFLEADLEGEIGRAHV